jgi:hypothetical protein
LVLLPLIWPQQTETRVYTIEGSRPSPPLPRNGNLCIIINFRRRRPFFLRYCNRSKQLILLLRETIALTPYAVFRMVAQS